MRGCGIIGGGGGKGIEEGWSEKGRRCKVDRRGRSRNEEKVQKQGGKLTRAACAGTVNIGDVAYISPRVALKK